MQFNVFESEKSMELIQLINNGVNTSNKLQKASKTKNTNALFDKLSVLEKLEVIKSKPAEKDSRKKVYLPGELSFLFYKWFAEKMKQNKVKGLQKKLNVMHKFFSSKIGKDTADGYTKLILVKQDKGFKKVKTLNQYFELMCLYITSMYAFRILTGKKVPVHLKKMGNLINDYIIPAAALVQTTGMLASIQSNKLFK